jgi:hypothetical protein
MQSSKDLSNYYSIVNDLIDEYVNKWKIRPSKLRKYFRIGGKNYIKFIKRNNLENIENIGKIVKDIIDDRYFMEKDGVLTFESFNISYDEDINIFTLIERVDIDYEKAIADYYDTNLGSINLIDTNKHIFEIENWDNNNFKVMIMSNEDIDILKNNISEIKYNNISSDSIKLGNIDIKMYDVLSEENFKKNLFDKLSIDVVIEHINEYNNSNYEFGGEFKNYYFFTQKDATS